MLFAYAVFNIFTGVLAVNMFSMMFAKTFTFESSINFLSAGE